MNNNLQQWFNLLSPEQVAHIKNLMASIYDHEETPIYPLKENVFKAFELTSPDEVRNILKELESDLGESRYSQDLTSWGEQGVLLLNASLTVKEGQPNSMAKDWEQVTKWFIEAIDNLPQPIVFILWGKNAQSFMPMIEHKDIIHSAHPSPFSASRGFFGSKPFSKTNELLEKHNIKGIDWVH